MYSTESPPLNDDYPQRDVDASDLNAERASSNRVHRLGPRPYRSSGFKNAQFTSDGPSITRRLTRKLARFFLVVLIGVGGSLAWQHGDEVAEMVRTWAPSLGWLLPVSTIKAPAPNVTTADLKPVAIDLALVRRSIEQLGANQDQLARKQDQMAQAIATLQAAEQDISQKILALAPPAPKAVHVSAKPAQPPTQ
ncbi:MAG TPA: hypothetical protein VGZ89_07395 [Xanthobacteraceae bacterium]|nr:hypothetical protein [Xanthobacteraceae bacterium]